jgi:glycosyltransferase involved in cell wall biosynthesis
VNYLLINHVPFGRGHSAGTFAVGDMWLEDLRAQARAIAASGMNLIVATPLMESLDLKASGSFNSFEITPQDHGFEYAPLPFYISLKQFLKVKGKLIADLADAIKRADVVHCGYGGHPVALGEVAWPIAAKFQKKRIWIFDGADPFPRLELHAREARNPLKRFFKKLAVANFEKFCRRAVSEADLVFAHNVAVVERFKDAWEPARCHQFDRSFVTDANLLSDAELADRQRKLLDDSQPLKLVAAGRQIAIKATDHVLRAMRAAIDRGARLELDVMGDGEDLAKFQQLAAELKLDGVVRFSGTVPYGPPLFDAWAKSHVMVITNLTAEISRNVLLAMARGLPLVMYSNPGTDALLRDSGAGTIVAVGDENALADALVRAASDRAALTDQAARGLAVARKNTLDATHRRRAQLAAQLMRGEIGDAPQAARAAAVS